jgi:hypothetical protein
LEEITSFYSFEEVPELAQALLDGKLRGPEPDYYCRGRKSSGAVSSFIKGE